MPRIKMQIKPVRFQMMISNRELEVVRELAKNYDCSQSEVLRKGIKMLDFLHRESQAKSEIIIRELGGMETKVRIL